MRYWDSGALVETISDPALKSRLAAEGGYSRSHTLNEMFSALSGGNYRIRISANDAASMIRAAASRLQFVNLTEPEILHALARAQALGVRGGRVHDYMHALAARKSGADALLTTDRNDFNGLVPGLAIEQV